MKKILIIAALFASTGFYACQQAEQKTEEAPEASAPATEAADGSGSAAIPDDVSERNVLQVAVGSKDHTTLVAAVKAAQLVDVLATVGPFTVFAPTNGAFDKLPPGTVDGLLKPEKIKDLQNVLEYHVLPGAFSIDRFTDGQKLGAANNGSVMMSVKDGKVMVNGAPILASVKCANGIVHVIDQVLLPTSN